MKNKKILGYVGNALLFVIPTLASAGTLTLKGTVPVGSSIQVSSTFVAAKHLWPVCGRQDIWDGWEPRYEYQNTTGQVQSDGGYEVSIDLNASHDLSADPLNVCEPQLSEIRVVVSPINGLTQWFTVHPFDDGDVSVNLSSLKKIALDFGLIYVNDQTNSGYNSIFIPEFSDQKDYQYTIDIVSKSSK